MNGRRKGIVRPPDAELLQMAADGMTRSEMAEKLNINRRTVGNWLLEAQAKLCPTPEPEETDDEPEDQPEDTDEPDNLETMPADRFIAWYLDSIDASPEIRELYLSE